MMIVLVKSWATLNVNMMIFLPKSPVLSVTLDSGITVSMLSSTLSPQLAMGMIPDPSHLFTLLTS